MDSDEVLPTKRDSFSQEAQKGKTQEMVLCIDKNELL